MMGLVSSGGRKTTSYQLAFKAHIDADEIVLARHDAALDAHKNAALTRMAEEKNPAIPAGSRPMPCTPM